MPKSALSALSVSSEFDLIKRYFVRPRAVDANAGAAVDESRREPVVLGIGDDCALLHPADYKEMAISTDMLVEGRHFFSGTDPHALGHKALSVNLSDLAAMGADPVAFTLALALPKVDNAWLEAFSAGLFALADTHACPLIGGDTTKGPLTICITVFGHLPWGAALRRDLAMPGDDIWVSGALGDARLALALLRNEVVDGQPLVLSQAHLDLALHRLHRPTPRIALGIALRDIAHAAIDISDGLGGDLAHILERSKCGAIIDVDSLPAGPALRGQSAALQRGWALSGGDDYELCFTAPVRKRDEVLAAGSTVNVALTRIGTIVADGGLQLLDAQGQQLTMPVSSFDHFRTT
ncbi:MAG: thiamine-phosphate kinase [Pseudomonadota bacterium]